MARPRPAPTPGLHPPCARCAQAHSVGATWPEGRVCTYCYLAAKRTTGVCADCGHQGVLPGRDTEARATCRSCSGAVVNVDCRRCGREAFLHSRGRCEACVLHEKIHAVLTGPDQGVPAGLAPLAEAVAKMPRANSGLTWLASPIVAGKLRGLADGTIPLTHDGLDALDAPSRAVEHLRALLVEHAGLPARDRRLADYRRWLHARLATVTDPDRRQVLERYGRWHHLRRLRAQAEQAPVSEAAFERAKQCLTVAEGFLTWLDRAGLRLEDLGQAQVDQWYAEGTTTAVHVETFLYWARENRLIQDITVPRRTHDQGPALGPGQRIDALRRILTDPTLEADDSPIALPVRVLAGLVLLFAQPINRMTRLTLDDLDTDARPPRIRLGKCWTEVPEPFAELITRHIASRPNMRTAANTHSRWLFPGRTSGQPLKPAYVSDLLIQAGIPALPTRAATWRRLVRQAPAAVLAEALGVSAKTAMRHAELAGTDYIRYATR